MDTNVLDGVENGSISIFQDRDAMAQADRGPLVAALKVILPASPAASYKLMMVLELFVSHNRRAP